MSAPQHIHIELDQCEGHGLCAATAPSVYDLDDDGFALRPDLEVPSELTGDAEAGLLACPMSAIRWRDT
ncbi:ferredoxin [Nocardia salmonicida]|uniref:ferredoxin n=1 Tax=Nocardia salmonicida TaxID=53431 RepID=UPI003405EDA8